MPTYDYECLKCGKNFEFAQSMKDDALTTCPKELCGQKRWGKGKVKRLLGTGAGLIFKGSGFYTTDYRSESYKQAAKNESGGGESKPDAPKPGSKPTGAGAGEAKPAAPTKKE